MHKKTLEPIPSKGNGGPFPDAAPPGSVEPDPTESLCSVSSGPWGLLLRQDLAPRGTTVLLDQKSLASCSVDHISLHAVWII